MFLVYKPCEYKTVYLRGSDLTSALDSPFISLLRYKHSISQVANSMNLASPLDNATTDCNTLKTKPVIIIFLFRSTFAKSESTYPVNGCLFDFLNYLTIDKFNKLYYRVPLKYLNPFLRYIQWCSLYEFWNELKDEIEKLNRSS